VRTYWRRGSTLIPFFLNFGVFDSTNSSKCFLEPVSSSSREREFSDSARQTSLQYSGWYVRTVKCVWWATFSPNRIDIMCWETSAFSTSRIMLCFYTGIVLGTKSQDTLGTSMKSRRAVFILDYIWLHCILLEILHVILYITYYCTKLRKQRFSYMKIFLFALCMYLNYLKVVGNDSKKMLRC
jgi:hypothetical protein